jgi:hypothetical protein
MGKLKIFRIFVLQVYKTTKTEYYNTNPYMVKKVKQQEMSGAQD